MMERNSKNLVGTLRDIKSKFKINSTDPIGSVI